MNNSIKKGVVVAVILLFVSVSVIPSTGTTVAEKSSNVSFDGNTLYVGGSGPGNYTKIQDAIDNASDGDTVFVFDDSSPYYEHVRINKRINLIGEDKSTTVIDGNRSGVLLSIKSNRVTVTGFTIQNAGIGILFHSNFNNIYWNNIHDNYLSGICLSSPNGPISASNNSRIFQNNISRNSGGGIEITGDFSSRVGWNNIIRENIILENSYGINLGIWTSCNIIYGNIVMSNVDEGITCTSGILNLIARNHVENNDIGIEVGGPCSFNRIRNNNIVLNGIDASFSSIVFPPMNLWVGNYWGRPYILPKPILGKIYSMPIPWTEPEISPWITFDIRPALKPYDILMGV